MTGAPTPRLPARDVQPPTGARILAAAGALLIAAYFGILLPLSYHAQGLPASAAALVITTIPIVTFLGLLAFAPDALQDALSRFTALDLRDGSHIAAGVIMASALYLIIGLGSIAGGITAVELVLTTEEGTDLLTQVEGDSLLVGLLQSVILLTLPVLIYVGVVHGGGPAATLRRIGLTTRRLPLAIGAGILATLATFLGLAIIGIIMTAAGIQPDENERALAIARSITILGAIAIAAGASIGEEIFFRGFLQPRIGLWGQAIVFAIAHLNYVNVGQIVVTLLLGLLFGWLYKRTGNLAAPMTTHFLFNLIMLLIGIYAEPPAGP